jgi:hypothetical protein
MRVDAVGPLESAPTALVANAEFSLGSGALKIFFQVLSAGSQSSDAPFLFHLDGDDACPGTNYLACTAFLCKHACPTVHVQGRRRFAMCG